MTKCFAAYHAQGKRVSERVEERVKHALFFIIDIICYVCYVPSIRMFAAIAFCYEDVEMCFSLPMRILSFISIAVTCLYNCIHASCCFSMLPPPLGKCQSCRSHGRLELLWVIAQVIPFKWSFLCLSDVQVASSAKEPFVLLVL